jgi:transposase
MLPPPHSSISVEQSKGGPWACEGKGVHLLPFLLPTKSPWLNPIEPKWVHGKRNVSEADRLLSADELETRVCAWYGVSHEPHLVQPKKVA